MTKHDRVLWFNDDSAQINGRRHKPMSKASTMRLLRILERSAFYHTLTMACTIYRVWRGKDE